MRKVDPKDFDSRWEFSKATSNYHFDPTIVDDEDALFKRIGRFVGDWRQELQDRLKMGGKPNTFVNRIGGTDPYTLKLDTNDLERLGVSEDWVLYDKYLLTPRCKNLKAMADFFKLETVGGVLHVQMPGQVFFYHVDNLTLLRSNQNDDLIAENPERAVRFTIALEDWQPGHVYAFGNTYWKQWKAGDIIYHSWIDTPHGTANLSHFPRATLQVTGIASKDTWDIIKSDKFQLIDLN